MRRMPPRERLELVRRMLNSKNATYSFRELAQLAGCNAAQITRDAKKLRKAGKLKR